MGLRRIAMLLLVAGCSTRSGVSTTGDLGLVPADSAIVVHAGRSSQPIDVQWLRFFAGVAANPTISAARDQLVSACGFDPVDLVDQITIGLPTLSTTPFVAILRGSFRKSDVESCIRRPGRAVAPSTETYRGTTIFQQSGRASIAVVADGLLIGASSERIHGAIDVWAGAAPGASTNGALVDAFHRIPPTQSIWAIATILPDKRTQLQASHTAFLADIKNVSAFADLQRGAHVEADLAVVDGASADSRSKLLGALDASFNQQPAPFPAPLSVFYKFVTQPTTLGIHATLDLAPSDVEAVSDYVITSGHATCPSSADLLSGVFGFESPTWTSSQATLALTATRRTQGCFGLDVQSKGYVTISSPTFQTSGLAGGATNRVALDLFIPGNPPNPSWLGAVQLYLTCPPVGFNQFIGQVELTGKPLNAFSTLTFSLAAPVLSLLNSPNSCQWSVALNTPVDRAQRFTFDNLRFAAGGAP
jgi:hypothetical protein